jgi:hypothetical protein
MSTTDLIFAIGCRRLYLGTYTGKIPLKRSGTRIFIFYEHFNLVLENATRKIATKPGGTICKTYKDMGYADDIVIIGRTQAAVQQTHKEPTNAIQRLGFPVT